MLRPVSLDDKYLATEGEVFLTGVQALVRLPMLQISLDRLAGLNTAGLVTGYPGSPLASYDVQVRQSAGILAQAGVRFEPGLNVGLGKDHSLFAKVDGKVRFEDHGARGRFISVLPAV